MIRVMGLALPIVIGGCVSTNTTYPASDGRARDSYVARGSYAMAATAHRLSSEAALAMLQQGGNAIDAAAAASFAVSVVRPQSTGIGGGGFMLFYEKRSGRTLVFDFRERAPGRASKNMFLDDSGQPRDFVYQGARLPQASRNGHLSAGVPGLVRGIVDIHGEFGQLPLAQVVAPAIELARQGFTVFPALARAIAKRRDVLEMFPASRQIFLPGGSPLKAGERLVQGDLARTLERIVATKGDSFYTGETAHLIAKEMKQHGLISAADLKSYRVKRREPIWVEYRQHRIASMPPPSSGGTHIAQILKMLESDPVGKLGHLQPASTHLLAEVMRRAYADRATYLGDPDFVNVPLDSILSSKYLRERRATIDPNAVTPSTQVHAGVLPAPESESTTHISVVDAWGNAVSTTQTINGSLGSGVIVPGTGVLMNNEMDDFSIGENIPNMFGLTGSQANAIAARKTMLSSMSPTLVFDPTGQLQLVLGSPGGSRIITATVQTIINVIDHGMPLEDAVHAHRIHHQWKPDQIYYERDGLPPVTVRALEAIGHTLKSKKWGIGDVQAVGRIPNGWIGVSDTRSDGVPMGY